VYRSVIGRQDECRPSFRRRAWRNRLDSGTPETRPCQFFPSRLEGADRVSESGFCGTAIASPSHPALHGGGSAAAAAIATDCHRVRTATAVAATAGEGAQSPVEKQVENVDIRKAEAEQRERRKRYADRKAKRHAERAKRQQQIEQGEQQEAPIMAFGGDDPRRSGGLGFFGN
jgi:hypothetical protein